MSRPQTGRARSTMSGPSARSLEGRLAIVTGASRGIGAAICENLASKGCSLVMNYTSDSSSKLTQDLASSLESQYSIHTLPVQASMGEPKGPAYVVETARNNFKHPTSGRFQIDMIVNNAAVAGNDPLENITIEEFDRQYHINVRGPILLVQAALPHLPNDRSGRIVNLSSVSSSCSFATQSVYGGTKAALESMTRTWARELAERCTVNAINPGPVSTEMYGNSEPEFQGMLANFLRHTPLARTRKGIDKEEYVAEEPKTGGRPATPQEIAGIVSMLCSDESSWCTGSVVCANGGMRMGM